MVTYLYQKNVLIYVMMGVGIIGFLANIICNLFYQKLLKASFDMGNSENKLLKLIRLRFETCYQLKLGVTNVDSFVNKYFSRHKLCGIFLYTWEKTCKQMIAICTCTSVIGSFVAYYFKFGQAVLLHMLSVGIVIVTILASTQIIFDIQKKKEVLYCNIKEYLENYLKAKLQSEILEPQQITSYRTNDIKENKKNRAKERFLAMKRENEKVVNKEIYRPKVELAAVQEQEKIIDEILKEYLA